MKFAIIAVFCALFAFSYTLPDQYTTKYDGIDLDQILRNDRLLKSYVNCLLEEGKCTKDGEELKKILPDALLTSCSKCNDVQKQGARKVIEFLMTKKRSLWDKLEAKYDPDGSYRRIYEKQVNEKSL